MKTIEERFSTALHNAARSWRQALDRRLKHLGVGQASWMTIAAIATANKTLSQTELAHKLAVEDPTMVSMIDRLVKAGFVLRQPSDTDRRIKLVLLTDAGQAIFARVRLEADAFRAELLQGIDQNVLHQLTGVLEALHTATESAL